VKIKKFAPVLIPTLDRYEHLKRCLDSLAKNTHASETLLYIALDAPAKDEHREGYNRIVEYLDKISGFKKVIVIKREKNFSAARNTLETLGDLFKKYDEIILSEDDNFFSPNFLDYINKGLQIFKNREDVFAICGYNYPIDIPTNYPYNFFLFKGAPGWGIGLWKNKYNNIDLSVSSVNEFLKSYRNILKVTKDANYLLPHLIDVVNKNHVAGDTIFSMNMVKNNMFCILPTISKVRNYGLDGTGVHCGLTKKNSFINQPIDGAKFFDFSTPEDKVSENKELTLMIQKKLKTPNVEVFKRSILFLARNTNLHKNYKKLKKIFRDI